MAWLTDYNLWASFISLTGLEIVLGIDNIVFIALVVGHLPKKEQQKARVVGLTMALGFRVLMLLGIVWIIGMKEPLIQIFSMNFSGKDLMMLAGGLFLVYKATVSIHEEINGETKHELKISKGNFAKTIFQIVIIDIVFSFDSVITAVGLTDNVIVIVAAMTIAMFVMLASSGYIADFIAKHQTIKMLALSFIMMIGVFLMGEGLGLHVPKGYIYFGMAFSLGIEILNMIVKKKNENKS